MKVLLLIDTLGAGGAQRQLCTLAVQFAEMGMRVSMLTYHDNEFFLPALQKAGVAYHCIEVRSIAKRALQIRRVLRRGSQDVVLAFLNAPGLYAELAGIPRRRWGLVVSERSAVTGSHRGWSRWRRSTHWLADYVVTNSHTNRLMVERSVPWLSGRVATIYNAVDLREFSPANQPQVREENALRIVVAGNYRPMKNAIRFIEALKIVADIRPDLSIRLDWYGRRDPEDVYEEANRLVVELGLQQQVHLHLACKTIADEYRRADVVALPSTYEGLPNTVCEAMACGRPVLTGRICDAGNLVKEGKNGFLFVPTSPEDIARAILRFADLEPADREKMGRQSRYMAEQMFNPTSVATRYATILSAAAERKLIQVEHWIPTIPDSAHAAMSTEHVSP